jgi:hypothetical protein
MPFFHASNSCLTATAAAEDYTSETVDSTAGLAAERAASEAKKVAAATTHLQQQQQ